MGLDDDLGHSPNSDHIKLPLTEVHKLTVELDEILVLKVPKGTSQDDQERLYLYFKHTLGHNRIIVVPEDINLEKMQVKTDPSVHPLYSGEKH